MWAMAATAILTAASTVMSSEQSRMQQQMQGQAMEAQANATRRQAELQQQKGELEARNIEKQKRQLRREFEQTQGHNRSLLAAGNVDMSSGSAMDVSLGNIDRFAAELQQNAYDVRLKQWETSEQVKAMRHQADVYDAQGSYLQSSAGSLGTSLLKGAIAGGASFASMYMGSGLAAAGSSGLGSVQGIKNAATPMIGNKITKLSTFNGPLVSGVKTI